MKKYRKINFKNKGKVTEGDMLNLISTLIDVKKHRKTKISYYSNLGETLGKYKAKVNKNNSSPKILTIGDFYKNFIENKKDIILQQLFLNTTHNMFIINYTYLDENNIRINGSIELSKGSLSKSSLNKLNYENMEVDFHNKLKEIINIKYGQKIEESDFYGVTKNKTSNNESIYKYRCSEFDGDTLKNDKIITNTQYSLEENDNNKVVNYKKIKDEFERLLYSDILDPEPVYIEAGIKDVKVWLKAYDIDPYYNHKIFLEDSNYSHFSKENLITDSEVWRKSGSDYYSRRVAVLVSNVSDTYIDSKTVSWLCLNDEDNYYVGVYKEFDNALYGEDKTVPDVWNNKESLNKHSTAYDHNGVIIYHDNNFRSLENLNPVSLVFVFASGQIGFTPSFEEVKEYINSNMYKYNCHYCGSSALSKAIETMFSIFRTTGFEDENFGRGNVRRGIEFLVYMGMIQFDYSDKIDWGNLDHNSIIIQFVDGKIMTISEHVCQSLIYDIEENYEDGIVTSISPYNELGLVAKTIEAKKLNKETKILDITYTSLDISSYGYDISNWGLNWSNLLNTILIRQARDINKRPEIHLNLVLNGTKYFGFPLRLEYLNGSWKIRSKEIITDKVSTTPIQK